MPPDQISPSNAWQQDLRGCPVVYEVLVADTSGPVGCRVGRLWIRHVSAHRADASLNRNLESALKLQSLVCRYGHSARNTETETK